MYEDFIDGYLYIFDAVMEFMGVNLSSVVVGAIIFICGAYLVSHAFILIIIIRLIPII